MDLTGIAKILELLLLAVIAIGGVLWQYLLIIRDKEKDLSTRAFIAVVIGILGILGVLVRAFMSVFDDRLNLDGAEAIGYALAEVTIFFGVMVAFYFKMYLSPLLTTFTILSAVYNLFEYGKFELWDFAEKHMAFILKILPDYLEPLYTLLVLILVPLGAVLDMIDSDFIDDIKDKIF